VFIKRRPVQIALPDLPRETLNFAVVDIECNDLYSHDFIFCVGIKPLGRQPYVLGLRDFPRCEGPMYDQELLRETKRHLEFYEGWVGWNSKSFDRPMLNDRLQMAGFEPLERRFHIDLIRSVRWPKSRTRSASLDWCAKQFGCPYVKTDMNVAQWKDARNEAISANAVQETRRWWNKGHAAYDKIVEHNLADLRVTEWMLGLLKPRLATISKEG